jgi:parvulin-like peptidyl-prolyl isomerase
MFIVHRSSFIVCISEHTPVKKDLTFAVSAIVLTLLLCYGLAAALPNHPPTPSRPFTLEKSGGKPAAALAGETVVMHVNGEPVTEREFMMYMQSAPQEMQAFYASGQGRELLAQEIVKIKALAQEAERLGIQNDADTAVRLNVDRSNILAGMALRKMVTKPSEERLRAEYAKDKKSFETVDLSHILISYEGAQVPPKNGQQITAEEAMKRAQEVSRRLRAGGDFAAAAREVSDDVQSGQNGGFLGPVGPGAMPPELDAAVMKLQSGQISDPVPSQFGIHIFKAGERKAAPLQEQVREALAVRIQRAEADAAVAKLQAAAKVDLDPKFFAKGPGQPMQGMPGQLQRPPQPRGSNR